jgi:hypothetical protein
VGRGKENKEVKDKVGRERSTRSRKENAGGEES